MQQNNRIMEQVIRSRSTSPNGNLTYSRSSGLSTMEMYMDMRQRTTSLSPSPINGYRTPATNNSPILREVDLNFEEDRRAIIAIYNWDISDTIRVGLHTHVNPRLAEHAKKLVEEAIKNDPDTLYPLTDETKQEIRKHESRLSHLSMRKLKSFGPFERDLEVVSRINSGWWNVADFSNISNEMSTKLELSMVKKISKHDIEWKDAFKYVENLHFSDDNSGVTSNDAPEAWGVFFQDNATPQMEGLEELHNNIMYYLAIIMFAVSWMMLSIIINYRKAKLSNKYVNHGTLVELIWTITPALILVLIAFPSFKLLYLMDEVIDPALVIYGEGHQWYWSYQYPDFINNDEEFIEYDSYIVPESDLELGKLRMLEVDNRVIIPELTHTRFVVGGADVIHSYACPALGIKCDAYPGRLNQSSVYLNREGTFFGQCSEICGILHSSMPIAIQSVSLGKFLYWLYDQIEG